MVLWCYLIWYFLTIAHHFDRSPRIWLSSLGIAAVIGFALKLSVNSPGRNRWQTFRLFLMPFCVSSFSSLTKGQDFTLIFPPRLAEFVLSAGTCAAFVTTVLLIRLIRPVTSPLPA